MKKKFHLSHFIFWLRIVKMIQVWIECVLFLIDISINELDPTSYQILKE